MDNRNEIREFLASRRARIAPGQAGLPAYGANRRVPGLRREEVALLARVSVDYDTQMERGNLGGVSDSVLDALAGALQLDEAERSHLFNLARTANAPTRARPRSGPQRVRPSVQRLLDAMTGGDVWYDVIASGQAPSPVRVNVVRFAPGARKAWHAHALGQTLHVTEGVGLIRSRGGQALQIRAGDTIYTPPGEWHWHGAAPDHFMSHLAIWEAPDTGPESQWGDLVTDDEYHNR